MSDIRKLILLTIINRVKTLRGRLHDKSTRLAIQKYSTRERPLLRIFATPIVPICHTLNHVQLRFTGYKHG